MNNTNRHLDGVKDQVVGAVKKNVGKAIGNEQMEVEGAAREVVGDAKVETARTVERAKGAVEEVTGNIKQRVGEAIDNQQMQVEGAARAATGEARQALNRPAKP